MRSCIENKQFKHFHAREIGILKNCYLPNLASAFLSVPEILISNTNKIQGLLNVYFTEFLKYYSENDAHVINEPVEVFQHQILGKGACGEVFRGIYRDQSVAVKIAKPSFLVTFFF